MCRHGAHHPYPTMEASVGAISPNTSYQQPPRQVEHTVEHDEQVDFTGAGVLVIARPGALLGRAGHIWQEYGGDRERTETPSQTAFRELQQESGLAAEHAELFREEPIWVRHAGYHHAVLIAILSDANRCQFDIPWLYGDVGEELEEHRSNFKEFSTFFET